MWQEYYSQLKADITESAFGLSYYLVHVIHNIYGQANSSTLVLANKERDSII